MNVMDPRQQMKSLNWQRLQQKLQDGALLMLEEATALIGLSASQDLLRLQEAVQTVFPADTNVHLTRAHAIFLTNLCELKPAIYGYARSVGDPDAFTLNIDEIDERLEAAQRDGADQVLVTGGMFSELEIPGMEAASVLKQYGRLVSHLRTRMPEVAIEGFSVDEIDFLRVVSDRSSAYILAYLKDMGLDFLGGHHTDILVDSVRQKISPKKMTVREWEDVMAEAVAQGLSRSVSMAVGHGETIAQRVSHLEKIRAFLGRHPGAFERFSLQPVLKTEACPGTRPAERLQVLALCRLFLGPGVPRVQAHWTADLDEDGMIRDMQEALHWGGNDAGSVAAAALSRFLAGTGHDAWQATTADLEAQIRAADCTPVLGNSGVQA